MYNMTVWLVSSCRHEAPDIGLDVIIVPGQLQSAVVTEQQSTGDVGDFIHRLNYHIVITQAGRQRGTTAPRRTPYGSRDELLWTHIVSLQCQPYTTHHTSPVSTAFTCTLTTSRLTPAVQFATNRQQQINCWCVADIDNWMSSNRLKLNTDKIAHLAQYLSATGEGQCYHCTSKINS